jgi:hypothetical protein
MSLGSPSTFGFHDALPEATLDPEWRALISQQVRTLAAVLSRVQTTVAVVHHAPEAHRSNAARRQTLAAQAQQPLSLERELVQLWVLVTNLTYVPSDAALRTQRPLQRRDR